MPAAVRPRPQPRRTAHGFTLIETLVTLAIATVLIVVAVPALRDLLRNNRLTAAGNDLLYSVTLARTEAVKRQTPAVVCVVADSTVAAPVCTGAGGKTTGASWIVFADTNGNSAYDAGEAILERHAALSTEVTMLTDGNGIVAFDATGFASPLAAATLRNAVFCDARGLVAIGSRSSTERAVTLSGTGRAQVVAASSAVQTALTTIGSSCP
jgi:type IV fimbrial biogenesis protein FimT